MSIRTNTLQVIPPTKVRKSMHILHVNNTTMIPFLSNMIFQSVKHSRNTWSQNQEIISLQNPSTGHYQLGFKI